MFDIKNGIVSVNKTCKLSPKQLHQLSRLADNAKTSYLMSIMGLVKQRVFLSRIKKGTFDALASKEKGSILKQMSRLRRLDYDHAPTMKSIGHWIGVEIECIIPYQDGDSECNGDCEDECNCRRDVADEDESHRWLRQELRNAGVNRVNVKGDGSVSDEGEGHGVECTILFNSSYGFEPLIKLCSVLKRLGCYVNKSCGLHVHLDARHLTPKKVTRIGQSLGHALPVLKWLVPESRHDNTYCKLGVSPLRGDRYHAINLTAFGKYKTIEIRLHSGSINSSKIINWIKILKLVGKAKLTKDLVTFQDLIDIGLNDELTDYADTRISELNPSAWTKLMPVEVAVVPSQQIEIGA